MNNHNYEVLMVMNNNVILTKTLSDSKEKVLIGKGIGFGLKKGKTIYLPDEKIEKAFVTKELSMKDEFYRLVQEMDINVMGVCEEIIHMAQDELGELNSHIHIDRIRRMK